MGRKPSVVLLCCLLCLVSCGDSESGGRGFVNMLTLADTAFPVLMSAEAVASDRVELVFDENIFADDYAFYPCRCEINSNVLTLYPPSKIKAGESVRLEGTVRDVAGNSATFSIEIWGYNPDPAVVRINEFTTKGTKTQPDRTELRVQGGGNLAGMAVYDGIPGDFRTMCILPDENVGAGDFVVIWWCEALPAGVDRHSGRVVNICAGGGLSENNGVLSVSVSPAQGADVQDVVVYSSGESVQYEGFGTKEVLERVVKASSMFWWDGEPVYSGWSASTRSMALGQDGRWYTTVQGGSSFGGENMSGEYLGSAQ